MSRESAAVTHAHFAYLAARTTPEDRLLRDLKAAAAAAGLPQIWISAEQGSFLQILLRLARARRVVEVGTLGGYSAIWMARALSAGGRLDTIELDARHADFAEAWIARSNVADRVRVHRGDGREVLARFEDGSADAIFIDADKTGYRAYFEEARRILRPGGLVLVDNAFAFGCVLDEAEDDPGVRAIREFNDHVAASGLSGIIVPFGDGLWVAVND